MLLSYNDCLKQYGNNYQIHKLLDSESLFKVSEGLYSDKKNITELGIIVKKYSNAVLTMRNAFYYHGLTDVIPDNYDLMTDRNAAKIKSKKIKQYFCNSELLYQGAEKINYDGTDITIYNKERMLIELVRYKKKLPYDYYKEIISHYRNILYELDVQQIEELAEIFPKSRIISETIQAEVF